jgi:glycosyltransferase involved in cell wall biosynthesis
MSAGKLRVLLVIAGPRSHVKEDEIAQGKRPRIDNYALQRELAADVVHLDDALATPSGRLLARLAGARMALAWAAFVRRHAYDVIYTTTESIGLPLALLLKLSGTTGGQPRHVSLAHYLTPFKKRLFFRFGIASHIDILIVHSTAQYQQATRVLPPERIALLPYFVDLGFWQAADEGMETREGRQPLICAVGREFRDYATLIKAVASAPVVLRIVAGVARMVPLPAGMARLPANVTVEGCDFVTLRSLYVQARFVVVPLHETDFQAGITAILEAMAMGKAVIVSGIRGQTDVVRDPRKPVVPGFLAAPGFAGELGALPTGLYVAPGDPHALRETIDYLLHDPQLADELGRNGRRVVEAYFSLEQFVESIAAAICGEPAHYPTFVK